MSLNITLRYYGFFSSLTKKLHEELILQNDISVKELIDYLTKIYGFKFKELCFIRPLYSDRVYCNINLNTQEINNPKVFPEGLDTKLNDGDMVSFGVISGAA